MIKNQVRVIKLVILTIFLGSSCTTGIEWNPDFYFPSHTDQSIENESNDKVYCNEPDFEEFACLSREKIMELAEILKKARLPKNQKKKIMGVLNGVLNTPAPL